jgi:hypothetical protein
MELMESSFDLMTNPCLKKRKLDDANSFVLNDAVVIRQKIKASPVVIPVVEKWIPNQVQKFKKRQADSLKPNNKHIMTKLAF